MAITIVMSDFIVYFHQSNKKIERMKSHWFDLEADKRKVVLVPNNIFFAAVRVSIYILLLYPHVSCHMSHFTLHIESLH